MYRQNQPAKHWFSIQHVAAYKPEMHTSAWVLPEKRLGRTFYFTVVVLSVIGSRRSRHGEKAPADSMSKFAFVAVVSCSTFGRPLCNLPCELATPPHSFWSVRFVPWDRKCICSSLKNPVWFQVQRNLKNSHNSRRTQFLKPRLSFVQFHSVFKPTVTL